MLAFFACGAGDFLVLDDSDPEVLMRQPGSPFEFLVSQTTSHPYGNAIMARELGVVVFQERPPTFGEAVRRAKWRTMYQDDDLRQFVDAMAVLFMTAGEMQDVKDSHVYTYNLLGDPALAMRYPPVPVTIEADEEAVMGGDVSFHGAAQGIVSGTALVTLEVEVTSVPWDLEPVANPHDPQSWPTIQANHAKVMNKVLAQVEVPVVAGGFSGVLPIPQTYHGRHFLKVLARDDTRDGIAHRSLTVRPPPP